MESINVDPVRYTQQFFLYGEEYGTPIEGYCSDNVIYHYQSPKQETGGKFIPGQFRINPHSVERITYTGDGGEVILRWDLNAYMYYRYIIRGKLGMLPFTRVMFSPVTVSADQGARALQKASAKVGSSEAALMTDLGELKETLQMLRQPLQGLRRLHQKEGGFNLDLLKKIRFAPNKKAAARIIDEFSSAWLQYQYGLKPLVSSIVDTASAVRAQLDTAGPAIKSEGSTIKHDWTEKVSSSVSVCGQATLSGTAQIKHKTTTRGRVYYERFLTETRMQRLGISPEFFPELFWELTRLSFVWDWIISIGPWLGQIRVKPGIRILGNTVSTKVESRGRLIRPKLTPNSARTVVSEQIRSFTYFREAYDRTTNVDLPSTPLLRYYDGASVKHIIDGLALLAQGILKK